jgi:hypothetical protein
MTRSIFNKSTIQSAITNKSTIHNPRSTNQSPISIPQSTIFCCTYAGGLKYSTIAAPIAVTRKPRYNIGLGVVFGGCMAIV